MNFSLHQKLYRNSETMIDIMKVSVTECKWVMQTGCRGSCPLCIFASDISRMSCLGPRTVVVSCPKFTKRAQKFLMPKLSKIAQFYTPIYKKIIIWICEFIYWARPLTKRQRPLNSATWILFAVLLIYMKILKSSTNYMKNIRTDTVIGHYHGMRATVFLINNFSDY